MSNQKTQIRWISATIRDIPFILTIFFLFAIICLLNYECKFITLSMETDFTTGINKVAVEILYAFVTGFIFYFFIELLPTQKKKIALFRLINNNTGHIYDRTIHLLDAICHANNSPGKGYKMYMDEFINRAEKINIHTSDVKVWFYPKSSFKEFTLKTCEEIKNNVSQLIDYSVFLDEKWLNHISHIQDAIRHIQDHLDLNGKRSTMGIAGHDVWVLYGEVKKLFELSNTFHKNYYQSHRLINPPGSYIPRDLFFEVRKHI